MLINGVSIFFTILLIICIVLICIPNRWFSTRTHLRQTALISIAVGCAVALCGVYQATFIFFVIGTGLLWFEKHHCLEQRFKELQRRRKLQQAGEHSHGR